MKLFRSDSIRRCFWLIMLTGEAVMAQPKTAVMPLSYYHDPMGRVTVEQLTKPTSGTLFRPFLLDSVTTKQAAGSTLWLRFVVQNLNPQDSLTQVFYVGRQTLLRLFALNDHGQLAQMVSGGTLSDWPASSLLPDGYGLPFRVPPGQRSTVLVEIRSGLFFINALEQPVLYSPDNYRTVKNDLFFRQRWLLIFYAFAVGCLFFGSSFALFQYATRRDRALIYYAGVSFFSALILIRIADYNLEIRTVTLLVPRLFAYEYPTNVGAAGCYLLFLREVLQFRQIAPRLHRLSNWLIGGCGVIFALLLWLTPYLIDQATGWVALTSLPLLTAFTTSITISVLTVVGLAYYRKLPLSGYFLTGLLLIAAGYTAMMITIFAQHAPAHSATGIFWNTPSIYLTMGILGEMLCFSLALGERTRQSEWRRIELEAKRKALEKEAAEALLLGQTQERRRVAAELHDTLGGTLAAIRLMMNSLSANELSTAEQITYQQLVDMVGMAIRQMRHLAHNLLPDELAKQGLVPSLHTLLDNLNLNQQTRFVFTDKGLTHRLDKQTEFTLYAICLEVCHNVLKHAHATKATVDLVQQADKLHLLICDNGVGFDTGADSTKTGMGLTNLQERADGLGATLTVWSQPNEGSVVSLWVPLSEMAIL